MRIYLILKFSATSCNAYRWIEYNTVQYTHYLQNLSAWWCCMTILHIQHWTATTEGPPSDLYCQVLLVTNLSPSVTLHIQQLLGQTAKGMSLEVTQYQQTDNCEEA